MYALDFEYDGQLLSNFGFMICEFDGSYGVDMLETGFNITFDKASRNNGKKNSLISSHYDECYTTSFHICKDPNKYDDLKISSDEYRELVRWLGRSEFLKFRIINEDDIGCAPCYYNASFNFQKITINDILYGLALTMQTDAPFGYGDPYENTWEVEAGATIKFDDQSDEIGLINPEITVVCKATGDLVITNTSFASSMIINNCSVGEVISISGDAQIITTSFPSHKIFNDFNYEFLAIGNNYDNRTNVISFSQPCTFTIKYNPIITGII